jgi:hypothetical protein
MSMPLSHEGTAELAASPELSNWIQDLLPRNVRNRQRDVMVSYWPKPDTKLVISYDPADDMVMISTNESLPGKDNTSDC